MSTKRVHSGVGGGVEGFHFPAPGHGILNPGRSRPGRRRQADAFQRSRSETNSKSSNDEDRLRPARKDLVTGLSITLCYEKAFLVKSGRLVGRSGAVWHLIRRCGAHLPRCYTHSEWPSLRPVQVWVHLVAVLQSLSRPCWSAGYAQSPGPGHGSSQGRRSWTSFVRLGSSRSPCCSESPAAASLLKRPAVVVDTRRH